MYALLSYVLEYSILITGNIDHKMEYLSFINIVKSAYLRLLIFRPAILITACASSFVFYHPTIGSIYIENNIT